MTGLVEGGGSRREGGPRGARRRLSLDACGGPGLRRSGSPPFLRVREVASGAGLTRAKAKAKTVAKARANALAVVKAKAVAVVTAGCTRGWGEPPSSQGGLCAEATEERCQGHAEWPEGATGGRDCPEEGGGAGMHACNGKEVPGEPLENAAGASAGPGESSERAAAVAEEEDEELGVALRCAASVGYDGYSWFRPSRRYGSPDSAECMPLASDCIPGVATWRSGCSCAADMCWPFPSPLPFQKCASETCTAVICLACCGDAEACDVCGRLTPYQELVCAPCLSRQRRAGKAWVGPPCACGNRVCRDCTACACPPSPVPLGSNGRSFAEGAASAAYTITPGVANSWDPSSGGTHDPSRKRKRTLVSPTQLALLLTTSPPPPAG